MDNTNENDRYNSKQLAKKSYLLLGKEKKDVITINEFFELMKKLEISLSKPKMKKLFEIGDETHCGQISYKELKLIFNVHQKMKYNNYFTIYEAFMYFNENEKKEIDLYEFYEVIRLIGINKFDERQIHDAFINIVNDENGFMNYNQFINFIIDNIDIEEELKKRNLEGGKDELKESLLNEEKEFEEFDIIKEEIKKENIKRENERDENLVKNVYASKKGLFQSDLINERIKEQQDDKQFQELKTTEYKQKTIKAVLFFIILAKCIFSSKRKKRCRN